MISILPIRSEDLDDIAALHGGSWRSAYRGIYSDALDKKIGTIHDFDRSRDAPTYRFFDATCTDRTSNWTPYKCTGSINRVPNDPRKHSILSLAGGLFHPEKDMTQSDREYRLRKPGS